MDPDLFAERVRALYGGDLDVDHPIERRFGPLMADVSGMASENKLALLNVAAASLEPGQAYVEVGTWKGLSLIAAMMGNEGPGFYAVENFHGFGVDRAVARAELLGNLRRWGVAERVTLVERNAFRALARPRPWLREPIGVFFYDGSHDRLAHYLAFGMAEPLLADRALVIVDDTDWRGVRRATDLYVARHRGYRLLVDARSRRDSDLRWWNGLRVYAFERQAPALGWQPDLAWRRAVYVWAYEPAVWLGVRAAMRALEGRPGLAGTAKRAAERVAPLLRGSRPA